MFGSSTTVAFSFFPLSLRLENIFYLIWFFGVFLLCVCVVVVFYIEAAFPIVGIQNTGEINLCLQ